MPDASPRGEAAWPTRKRRLLPGLQVLQAPPDPRYEASGDPSCADAALEDALRRLADDPASPKIITAHHLRMDGPAWTTLADMARAGRIALTPIVKWERAILERSSAADAETYLTAHLTPSHLRRLRRKQRALRAQGQLALAVSATPAEAAAGLEAFCALEAAGWKGRTRTALTHDPAGLAVVETRLGAGAATDEAFTAILTLDGLPIAAGLFLRKGGEALFWKTTYDETLAKHSPGVVFDVMLTAWLYAQPWFERLDAGHDDSVDPDSLIWKQRRAMAHVAIDLRPGSLKGRAVVAAMRLRQRLRAWRNARQSRNHPAK
jgi:CelD/BcsL family acetyltransferase involved in cellulose biosynthesis